MLGKTEMADKEGERENVLRTIGHQVNALSAEPAGIILKELYVHTFVRGQVFRVRVPVGRRMFVSIALSCTLWHS